MNRVPSQPRETEEIMAAADWSHVLSRNLLAPFEKRDNRYHLGARRLHVDCLVDLLAGFDCRGGSSLELGCGTGLDSVGLHERLGLNTGMLVDFCPEAVAIARQNARGRNLEVVQSHVLELTTDRRFDIAFSVGLIEHFRGTALRRVLARHGEFVRPGGRVLLLAPRRGILWPAVWALNQLSRIRESPPTNRELRRHCEESGFQVLKLKSYLFGVFVGAALATPAAPQTAVESRVAR
jgi:SAM-dependent methyltransferase